MSSPTRRRPSAKVRRRRLLAATITVTVTDNGGTANGGQNTVSQTFMVTVTQVNQPPTLDPLKNPAIVKIDGERVKYWLSKGAQPSDTVRSLLRNPKPA